ncbi:MAG TPA: heme ABC exporter ATP-binding protein CcmA [Acidimicrobiales bacterium]|nr:heme ABC exporter ATP-binding protein CcmA [Acidimicrobiales bacterium]
MAPAVLLRAAVCVTGRFPALAGVDLEVDAGETVVLEGPNGAGKTTLLRLCAGLLPLSGGEAVVLGCDLAGGDRSGLRRRVGMLGHHANLYDDLTVAENVRFALRAAGRPAADADEAMTRLELVGRLRRTAVGRLSAGQRRRVALAVVVARRPELWLLDEPHAGLDRGGRALLGAAVTEAAAAGATVVLASHEPEESLPLADRVVTLAGGRVTGVRAASGPEAVARGGAHVA